MIGFWVCRVFAVGCWLVAAVALCTLHWDAALILVADGAICWISGGTIRESAESIKQTKARIAKLRAELGVEQ